MHVYILYAYACEKEGVVVCSQNNDDRLHAVALLAFSMWRYILIVKSLKKMFLQL